MELVTGKIKTRIGNSVLIVWLAAGVVGGIQIINWIPSYFGDKAGALLPAYMVALIVILLVGRVVIEHWLNRFFATTDAPILRAGTVSVVRTGTSFAVT